MMKEMKKGTFIYNDESYDFDFKTSLSAYDKQIFVKTVVNNLISDEGYDAVLRDLIFDFVIVEIFTNVDTSFINMKDDEGNYINSIILIEHFLENSSIVNIVKANMDDGLLDELNHAVDLNIQYLTGINPNPLNEAIASLLNTLEKKVNKYDMDSLIAMAQKFADMTGELTPENIVDAYINTDMHQKNLAEIEESKNE